MPGMARAALSLLLAAVFVTPAAAQSTLVSNTGQTVRGGSVGVGNSGFGEVYAGAQLFTTGNNTGGYTLSEVDLRIAAHSGGTEDATKLRLSVYSVSSGSPNASLHVLTNPTTFTDDAVNTFTAAANTTLDASTTYAIVFESTDDTKRINLRSTDSDSEDSGAFSGWSIANGRQWKEAADTSWSTASNKLLIAIKGTENTGTTNNPPTVATEIPDQTAPVGDAFSYAFPANTFNDADSDTLSYTATKSDGTALPAWLTFTASTRTFSGTPAAADVGTVSVKVTADDSNGGTVSDTFDIAVVTAPAAPGAPTVDVGSSTSLKVSWSAPSSLGSASAITDYDLRYFAGAADPANAADWIEEGETNGPPDPGSSTSATITGLTANTAYRVQVRAFGDLESPWSASASGTPVNRAPVFTATTTNPATSAINAPGGTTVTLPTDRTGFSDPDGDALTFTGTLSREDTHSTFVDNSDKAARLVGFISNSACALANLSPALSAPPAPRVTYTLTASDPAGATAQLTRDFVLVEYAGADGTSGVLCPTLTGAAVNAGTLTLTYEGFKDLTPSNLQKSEFTVKVAGTAVDLAETNAVTIGTSTTTGDRASTPVSLALAAAVSHGATVTVSHAPGASPSTVGFSDETVTNNTPAPNNAPVFANTTVTRSVAENSGAGTNVGAAVTATDADSDTLSYTLGGTDAASFAIGSASGQITVASGTDLNFEATKNSYSVTVTASDTKDTATANVTINVTDVDTEKPSAPDAPTVGATSGSTTSLDVSWTAPTNTGPAITDYDVRYFAGSADPTDATQWNDHAVSGTGVSTAIASLTANTAYRVQVRATNAEGTGDWSSSGSGTTNSPTNNTPTVANAIPDQAATAGKAFSYAFPANTFSDADNHTLSYTATQSDDTALPGWLMFTASSRTFAGTPLAANAGTLSVKVTADDSNGGTVSDTFDIDVNRAPAFANATVMRAVDENSGAGANVGAAVSAMDADGDTLSYTLGGADASSFDIGSSDGQLTVGMGATLDHETRSSYTVTVTAADATDEATATVTINVTDVAEKPAAPSAPTVNATSGSTTGLNVSWSAPANTGPAITDYDWRWKVQAGTTWTEKTDTMTTATSAAITGLTPGTAYDVQVRATNDEGTGNWSPSGSGTTNSPTNNAPTVANPIPDRTATAGTPFSYTFPANTFHDADGDTLSYTATRADNSALPGWLTFTGASRAFAGTPAASDVGTLMIKVTADDNNGASASDTFNITVGEAGDTPGDTPPPVTPRPGGGGGGGGSRPVTPEPTPPAVTVAPDAPGLTAGAPRLAPADDPATGEVDERRAGYTMTLSRRPTGPVTLTPQSSDPAIAAVSGPLTFSLADWDTPQTLTVTGVAPGRVEITLRLKGGGYDDADVPVITVIVGDGGADPRKALAPPPAPGEGENAGQQPDDGGGDNDGDSDGDGQPGQPDADDAGDDDGQPGQPGMNGDGDEAAATGDGQPGQADTDTIASPDTTGSKDAADDTDNPAGAHSNADEPDSVDPAPRLPDGALAALARGHLASARQALGPRLNPEAEARSQLTLAGQTLSLSQLLTPGDAGSAFDPDYDRAPLAAGLSWDQATGRCAAWYTASCAGPDAGAGVDPVTGRTAGHWDTLFYRVITGLMQGSAGDALWRGSGFALTLGGGDDPGSPGRRWTLWGRGHVQALAGLPAGLAGGADLRTGYLGIDTHLGANARTGFALSRSLSAGTLTTVHPYLSWTDGATSISALGGIGRGRGTDTWMAGALHHDTRTGGIGRGTGTGTAGEATPDDAFATLTAQPLGLRMGLVEVTRQLAVLGELTLDIRGDAAWAHMSTDNGVETQTETVRTLRLGAGAGGQWQVGRLTLAPALETHLRHDGGHGPTGRGLELLGGLSASHGDLRLTVQGRMLTTRSETAYRERGLETTLALGQPGMTGPSLALSARWGDAATGGDTLWREQLHYRNGAGVGQDRNNAWSLDARSEYGLTLPGGRLLTGFASLSHAGDGPRALVGLRLGLGAAGLTY